MFRLRNVVCLLAAGALSAAAACGSSPPAGPTPTPMPVVTASAYILPGAVSLGQFAFGDEPVVIFAGERLRWVNADTVIHDIVADAPEATDFSAAGPLAPNGGQQSFDMRKLGTTGIHCTIHPAMTGTLIVRDR
jgi:plastocyanin